MIAERSTKYVPMMSVSFTIAQAERFGVTLQSTASTETLEPGLSSKRSPAVARRSQAGPPGHYHVPGS